MTQSDPDLSTEIPPEPQGVLAAWQQHKTRVCVCSAYLMSCWKKKKNWSLSIFFNTSYLQQEDTGSTPRYCSFSWSSTYIHTKIHENVLEREKWFHSFLYNFVVWYMNVCADICTYVCTSVCLNKRGLLFCPLTSINCCAAFVSVCNGWFFCILCAVFAGAEQQLTL